MACGAVLQLLNSPFLESVREPTLRQVLVWIPVQIGNLVWRPQIRRRVAMALKAESHAERLRLLHLVHLMDLAMAMDAANSTIHVHGMVEVSKIGQLVNLHPGNGFACLGAFTDERQPRIILQNLVMSIHAG